MLPFIIKLFVHIDMVTFFSNQYFLYRIIAYKCPDFKYYLRILEGYWKIKSIPLICSYYRGMLLADQNIPPKPKNTSNSESGNK